MRASVSPRERPSRITTDIDFDRRGKQLGYLKLPHSVHRSAYGWIPIPIICIRNGEGPRLLLMAGNHGDEYEGQVTLIKLCRELEPRDIRGRVIILPAANFPAVQAGRRTSPLEDGESGNLNRSFPGDPDGPPTAMIAHYIDSVLLANTDYVFDLHSGGSSLMYIPSGGIKRSDDPAKTECMIEILKIFGAPISYIGAADIDRNLAVAAKRRGLIHMGTELGGGGTVTPEALRVAEQGLRRVLRHIGCLKTGRSKEEPPPTRMMEIGGFDYYVASPDPGLFEPLVDLGNMVKKGQPAAVIHFPEAPWRSPSVTRFRRAGMVICKRMGGRVEHGDCLFQLATDLH